MMGPEGPREDAAHESVQLDQPEARVVCDGTLVMADGRCERLGVVCMAEPTGCSMEPWVWSRPEGPNHLIVCVCVCVCVVVWGGVMKSWELFRG